jgi:hypothetical protein
MWLRSAPKMGCWRRQRRAMARSVSSSGIERARRGAVIPRMVADFWLQRIPTAEEKADEEAARIA